MVEDFEYNLSPLEHMGPVCGLKVLNNELLLAGEGPSLTIYNYITGEKIFSRIIFPRNKIHGIEFVNSDNDILISAWGSRSLSVFTLSQFKDLNSQLPQFGVGDWILHTLFSSNEKIHILTAHNIVHNVNIKNGKLQLESSKNCNWKSILYSGSLHLNLETKKITVLAGTVMNGIIIWDLESSKLLHNLTQHEGSIFYVVSSPDGKYLISCSDDRSIKVWETKSGKLVANGWGHGSRIWGLSIYNVNENGFSIFSAGEDLTSRVWTFKNDEEILIQERIVLAHTGRHVWSCTVNDNLKLGFTGGADGKVFVTDLGQSQRKNYRREKWELENISNQLGVVFVKSEFIKEYVDFGYGLFAVTSTGRFLVLKNYTTWELLWEDQTFERFCITKVFDKFPIVVLGNKLGNVYFIKFDEQCNVIDKVTLKLNDIKRLGNILISEYNDELSVFFESPNPQDPILYYSLDNKSLKVLSTKNLFKDDDKIVLNQVTYDPKRKYFIFACRFATIVLYQPETSEKPIKTFKHIIKGDTMSAIKIIPDEKCTFYLTNKDSSYYIVQLDENLNAEFLQNSKVQRGFLEGIIRLPNGDILFYGFKSDSFFVWNETKQYEVMREICGGPHRRWNFKYWLQNGEIRYRFVYTRASEVQMVQQGLPCAVEILATGLQGREIRDICIVNSVENENEKIVITGAEDTTLKISTLTKDGKIKVDWSYREHIAGIQSIHAVSDKYVLSSSGREELFVWKLHQCDEKKCMNLLSKLPPCYENPDLRVMNFDTIEVIQNDDPVGFILLSVYSNSDVKLWYFDYTSKKFKRLIDDNYKNCCIFQAKLLKLESSIYIMLGSTNGNATVYDISSKLEENFKFKNDVVSLSNNNFFVSKLENVLVDQQLHQSSIKALDLVKISSNKFLLITGGDDNALIASEIIKSGSLVNIEIKAFVASAASSTITSVNFIDEETVMVNAVDQNIKLWKFTAPSSEIDAKLNLLQEKYTTVADTGCAEIAKFNDETLAVVGGAGLSVWSL